MGFAVILIVTIALIIFFCMDSAGKINRQAEGTGVIYLAIPLLLTVTLCICAHSVKDTFDISEAIDEHGYLWEDKLKELLSFVGMCILAVVPTILSIIGCVRITLHNVKTKEQGMFGISDDTKCLSVWSKTSAALGAVCTLAFSIFAAVAAVKFISFAAVSSIEVFFAAVLFGCITFGIGFIIMALTFPMWVFIIGYGSIMVSIFSILAAGICGTALIVFQVLAADFTAAEVKKLIENGSITKKKAVLYIFLSLLPVVSIVNASRISKKLSVGV